jgi:hypothetical protein
MEFQPQEHQVQTGLQPMIENLANKNKSLNEASQQQVVIPQEHDVKQILPEHLSSKFY